MNIDSDKLVNDIYDCYLQDDVEAPKRKHLGASALGDKCKRHVYYEFRWYTTGIKEGRILRLFDTGKREESRVIEDLRNIGFVISMNADNGVQITCRDDSGHIGGSVDGIIHHIPLKYGFLSADKAILEIKTHSEKNFRKLKDGGIQKSFPKHYTQVQVYMGMMEIPMSLYVGVNKNTDELYFELVPYDRDEHNRAYDVAKEVVLATQPLDKIKDSPSWFECKMCKFYDVCHMGASAPKSCRTCVFSRPIAHGKWTCDFHNKELSHEMQVEGCSDHKENQ